MIRTLHKQWHILLLASIVMISIIAVGVIFYVRALSFMQQRLRGELANIAAASSLAINGDVLDDINNLDDLQSSSYQEIIRELDAVRRSTTNIRFVYILRRTNNAMTLEFVADADAALSNEQLDVNGNGRVDSDEEPAFPGEEYDISETPALQRDAFLFPTADEVIGRDQWGAIISGYAPIYRSDGTVAAVLGIDMQANDFNQLSTKVFSPVALAFLCLVGFFAAVIVIISWTRNQMQMLRRINGERSGLLRLTFHQLGEPLTIMKWSLETLREETEDPNLKKLVAEHVVCMDEGLGRLNSIIDVLQLAEKVDLNTLEYLPVPGSLRALVDNAVNEWESSIHKRNQHIHVFMDSDITMSFDKNLLLLVMRQLLENAIRYSDNGSDISIHVEQHPSAVKIIVEDEGCGIPQQDMEHLFEKYRRASNAHLKTPDGNGLGLYIAKGIIEKAGGSIRIVSKVGKGTRVELTLPLA